MVATTEAETTRTGSQGLTLAEVAERRAAGEVNVVPHPATRSSGRIVGQNLFTFLNLLIFAISGVLIALGLYVDAFMAGMLGVINALVAIVQELRAKRKLDAIAVLTRPVATVIREGAEQSVQLGEIVRGDLVVLQPGGQVVVDGPLVAATGLSLDESLLTGESELVSKTAGDTVYSGTFCMAGAGVYRAEGIGEGSTAGQIGAEARSFRDVKTPLQREIILLMRVLLLLILLMSLQVLGLFDQLYATFPFEEAARAAAVIVGLVPQGLVLMVSITYAVAVVRLIDRGALVQRMNAVESLSHVDVFCLDKTGTITTNDLRVQTLIPLASDQAGLMRLLGTFVASGSVANRTSSAIGAACSGPSRPVRHEAPFSADRKWSGLIFDDGQPDGAYILGAPEILAPALQAGADLDGARLVQLTEQGLRVLLFAHRPGLDAFASDEFGPLLPDRLVPLGIVALSDELRADARETISRFASAGIALKIISGDNVNTITALARQAGVPVEGPQQIVSGADLDGLDDAGYERLARQGTIFGRVTPRQKEELIMALSRQGHYVAMIGDGVNDVPALKKAHVAVAMRSGSDIARGVADVILLNDAFTVLPTAFDEGQRIRNGLKNTIELFLNRTLFTMLVIYATALGGDVFPVALRHGALVSMLAVGIPAFVLTLCAQPGKVERRALPSIFDVVAPAAVTTALAALVVYRFFLTVTEDVAIAQSALTTVTMLCGLAFILFLRPPSDAWVGANARSADRRPAVTAVLMLLGYLAVLFLPPLRAFYELEQLPLSAYLLIALIVPGWAVSLRLIYRLRLMEQFRAWIVAVWHRGSAWRTRRASPRLGAHEGDASLG